MKEIRPLAINSSLASIPLAIATLLSILGLPMHSGYLLTKICRVPLRDLVDPENGPLMARGGAKETEKVKESRPLAINLSLVKIPWAIATLLLILGWAVHSSTRTRGCPCACAVPPTDPMSATTVWTTSAPACLSSLGLATVHGPLQVRSVIPSHPMSSTASATQLSHSLLHSHRGVLQVSLVLLQEPRVQS